MICPVCKTRSFVFDQTGEGITLLVCETCRGHWVPSFVYWRWRSRRGANVPELPAAEGARSGKETKGAKLCPECGRILVKHRVRKDVKFTVDRCGNCAGIWLDAGEWDELLSRKLHDDLDYIFTAAWQDRMRREERGDVEEALLKKRIGAKDFDEIRRVRAWLGAHPQAAELRAYLLG